MRLNSSQIKLVFMASLAGKLAILAPQQARLVALISLILQKPHLVYLGITQQSLLAQYQSVMAYHLLSIVIDAR